MAGSWTELRGTRRRTENHQMVDYTFTAEAAAGTAVPTIGLAYADVVVAAQSGLVPSSTGLVAAPTVADFVSVKRFTEGYDRIQVRMRGFKVES